MNLKFDIMTESNFLFLSIKGGKLGKSKRP